MMATRFRKKKTTGFKRPGNKKATSPLLTRLALISLTLILITGGIAGTVYGIKKWMKCCPYFFVSNIEVTGNKKVDEKRIIRLSSIKNGQNIFSIDLKKARQSILKDPWIRDVSIERRLPDVIAIHIIEYEPFALTRIGKNIFLVDKYGTPFKPLEPKDAFSGPIITGIELEKDISIESLKDIKNISQLIDHKKMKDALLIIGMSKRGVRALGYNNISQIDFPNTQKVVIYTADRAVPFMLDRSKIKKQFYRAEKILVQLYNSGQYAKVISVNVGYGRDMALAKVKSRVK